MTKYVIIGGVAGGATAAARLRRLDESAEILLIERGEHISYANCGLPYYIGDTIRERENLFVQTPLSFGTRFSLSVRVLTEAVRILPAEKRVELRDVASGKNSFESYDKLLLSPGAEPVRPRIPGIDDPAIFTLRNVADTDRLKSFIAAKGPRRAVIVGAGFIGLEMAENLHNIGILSTIVEAADQVMTPLDYEMASLVHQHLKTKEVPFFLKDGVTSFARTPQGLSIRLQSGRTVETDMVILSVGVRPETKLAAEAGLRIGEAKGIWVDRFLRTSDPSIYAVGDAIEFPHPITGKSSLAYLAGPANRQGRIAADNMARGDVREYRGSIGTAIAKVFDITVAASGLAEKTLVKENIPYHASVTHSSSHAGYYPGAIPLTIKILFSPQGGRLLGAQVVGIDGVDKRLDLLATVIKNNGTIYDLQEIEHAYAPPYSSAKDPVNIAGYAAENILTGRVRPIYWNQIAECAPERTVLLDVRTPEEFELGTIPGAINIPVDSLRTALGRLPKDKTIVVLCGVGLRGYLAAQILSQRGYHDVRNLSGGYKTWEHAISKQSNDDIFAGDRIGKDDAIYSAPETRTPEVPMKEIRVDACGLQCPGPIMKLKKEFEKVAAGDRIVITASDQGFLKDSAAWCRVTGNTLVDLRNEKGVITAVIEKARPAAEKTAGPAARKEGRTIVVFSDDLDRALAAFVLANASAGMGGKVTLFFTFWGLNVIKRRDKPAVRKDLLGRMFSWMLPGSSYGLGLSKINMFGIGARLMRRRMTAKKVESLESMMRSAQESGVSLIACQMSMDVMGVDAAELIDGVTVAGAASYLEKAAESDLNLFI